MAPRSKKEASQFSGPLAEPIIISLEEVRSDISRNIINPHGLVEQLRKMQLLLEHYNIKETKGKNSQWQLLALQLAIDFVPGFQIVFDDSRAASFGSPVAAGLKAGRAGKGVMPELTGKELLVLVRLMKRAGGEKELWQTDAACAEFIYENIWPKTKRPTKGERQSALRTIKRRITAARATVEGPATITRSKSKLH